MYIHIWQCWLKCFHSYQYFRIICSLKNEYKQMQWNITTIAFYSEYNKSELLSACESLLIYLFLSSIYIHKMQSHSCYNNKSREFNWYYHSMHFFIITIIYYANEKSFFFSSSLLVLNIVLIIFLKLLLYRFYKFSYFEILFFE